MNKKVKAIVMMGAALLLLNMLINHIGVYSPFARDVKTTTKAIDTRASGVPVGGGLHVALSDLSVPDLTLDQEAAGALGEGHKPELTGDVDVGGRVGQRLWKRREHLKSVCSNINLDIDAIKKQNSAGQTFAHGKLHYCGIPKCGSTYMSKLDAKEKMLNLTFTSMTKDRSFVIVREPYGRMVSAYLDKMFTRNVWWSWFGRHIVAVARFKPSKNETRCGSDVTFPEFIKYFLHSQTTGANTNAHFYPMHEMCQFCYYDYDYYVHLETMKDDVAYMYKQVKHPLQDSMDDEQFTMQQKSKDFVTQRNKGEFRDCETACAMIDRTWWSLQARGLISIATANPVTGARCDTVTRQEFTDLCWKAHLETQATIDKPRQRRQMMVSLYRQVPLLDRLKVRQALMVDFRLHGYDATPTDIFPEFDPDFEKGADDRGAAQGVDAFWKNIIKH